MKVFIGLWWQARTWSGPSHWLEKGLYRVLVGGSQVGATTLIRFYAWHLFGLMLILLVIGVWHLFRVRRDGGIAVPPPDLRTTHERIKRKELSRREGLAMLWATFVLVLLALLVPAPLAPGIQAGTASASEYLAPWFFLWVQQLLKLGIHSSLGYLSHSGYCWLSPWYPISLPGVFQPPSLEGGSRWVVVMYRY